jgi:hypothetical protein
MRVHTVTLTGTATYLDVDAGTHTIRSDEDVASIQGREVDEFSSE